MLVKWAPGGNQHDCWFCSLKWNMSTMNHHHTASFQTPTPLVLFNENHFYSFRLQLECTLVGDFSIFMNGKITFDIWFITRQKLLKTPNVYGSLVLYLDKLFLFRGIHRLSHYWPLVRESTSPKGSIKQSFGIFVVVCLNMPLDKQSNCQLFETPCTDVITLWCTASYVCFTSMVDLLRLTIFT